MGFLIKVGAATVLWTVFQWWAVIGWPETIEGNLAALLLAGGASVVGLTAWHAWGSGVSWLSTSGCQVGASIQTEGRNAPVRALIIVASDVLELCDYLRRSFSEIPDVHVLLDRRRGERRGSPRASDPERRVANRRRQPDIDARLRRLGYVIALHQATSGAPWDATGREREGRASGGE